MQKQKPSVKVKHMLLNNWPWKIAAFFMALVLWFFILNITDPIRTVEIPLTLVLMNENALTEGNSQIHLENIDQLRLQQVRVSVRGNSSAITELETNLIAYIDLSTSDIINAALLAESYTEGLNVNIHVNREDFGEGLELLGIRPSNVRLNLDTIITRAIPVRIIEENEVHPDFINIRESNIVTPNVINVTGPAAAVNSIDHLSAIVRLMGRTASFSLTNQPVTPRNSAGTVLTMPASVTIADTVDIEVPVLRRGTIQFLTPYFLGVPPEGFDVLSIRLDTRTFEVAGDPDDIANLVPILLDPIPADLISSNTEPFVHSYNVQGYLPPGIFLTEGMHHMINATVDVEPIVERDFTISYERFSIVGLPPNVQVLAEEIVVTIRALRSIIDQIVTITPVAFLSNLDLPPGEHRVPLNISIPPTASIVGDMPMLTIYISEVTEEDNIENDEASSEEDDE